MNPHVCMVVVLVAGLSSGQASAQKTTSANLSVSSTMTQNTCYINGVQQNGSAVASIAIRLPTMSKSDFAGAGKVGPVVVGTTSKGNNIALTSCPANTNVALALDGSGSIDAATGTYKNTTTGGAGNLNVLIVDAENGANTALSPTGINKITKITDGTGAASFLLGARYYATGAVTAGAFTATAGFNISYP